VSTKGQTKFRRNSFIAILVLSELGYRQKFKIRFAVLTQDRSVTDGQTDSSATPLLSCA